MYTLLKDPELQVKWVSFLFPKKKFKILLDPPPASQRQKFHYFGIFQAIDLFWCLNVREFRQKSIGEGFKLKKYNYKELKPREFAYEEYKTHISFNTTCSMQYALITCMFYKLSILHSCI